MVNLSKDSRKGKGSKGKGSKERGQRKGVKSSFDFYYHNILFYLFIFSLKFIKIGVTTNAFYGWTVDVDVR